MSSKKPVTIGDITELKFVSNPLVSPDGEYVAFTVAQGDYKANDYKKYIYLYSTSIDEVIQLTHIGRESGFIWDNAHTLLFPAERVDADKPDKYKKKTVFYRLNVNGGEAQRAFEIPLNVESIKRVNPDCYLLTAEVDLNEPADDMDETLREDEKDYHVLEEVPFWANGRGYVSRLRHVLYEYNQISGELKQISPDYFDVESYDRAPGGCVYTGREYTDKTSIYGIARLYDAKTGETIDIIPRDTYATGSVVYAGDHSNDDYILLTLSDMQPWGSGQMHDFYRYSPKTGELKLAYRLDMPLGNAVLTDAALGGGKSMANKYGNVFFMAQSGAKSNIYMLTLENKIERMVHSDCLITAMDYSSGVIAYTAAKSNEIVELYVSSLGGNRKVTSLNDDYLNTHYIAEAKYIPFVDSDGVNIDGWVLLPDGFDESKKYPAALEIHGGPRCTFGDSFFHEMQTLVGAGYIVFFCNPRGSEGYGEEFADLRGRYGTIDYNDIMEFTDHVLALYPQIDEKRVCALGGSYGGFMCNWIEGHTDRFAAIASQRSISNWVADFGASEIGFTFDQNEMAATPWTDMEKMWAQSPLKFADRAKTPILFIHSLCDYNCTVDQGVEMFAAMKYFGVPSRMVLFEGENHSLSRSGKPRHRMRRLQEMLDWFNKYAGQNDEK